MSFHALRDYVPGDDRRNVHWRTTARVGRLMVRQFEETRRAHLLLILDLDPDAWADDQEFERGVSAAASLSLATMQESKQVSILTQKGSLKAPTAMRALDSLAGVERVWAAERLPQLARHAAAEVPQASVAVLVTGSRTSATFIRSAMAHLPLSMVCATARMDAGHPMELRTIGGFRVISLPRLDEFGLAMRKVLA